MLEQHNDNDSNGTFNREKARRTKSSDPNTVCLYIYSVIALLHLPRRMSFVELQRQSGLLLASP